MEKLLIACDFDGTITQNDTLHLIVRRYGDGDLWEAIEPRLRAGELTLEQAMEAEFAGVRATPEQVRELVLRDAGMRAGSPTSSRGRAIAATACSCCRRGSGRSSTRC